MSWPGQLFPGLQRVVEVGNEGADVRWKFGAVFEIVVGCRMMESQAGRMKSLACHAPGCFTIESIAQHGVALRGHVDANLVSSSGGERTPEKRR